MALDDRVRYRLADATAIEPLINQWSVWSDMISPLPYSLHMANYQLKTLESYLKRPEIHLKAARNPKLAGGAYVDVREERAGEVQALLDTKYVLFVGTIEPRKNHLFVLTAWRKLIAELGGSVPTLVLAGKLGWSYLSHRTDKTPQTALVALYAEMSDVQQEQVAAAVQEVF